MLAVAVLAQTATTVAIAAPAYLIPSLHAQGLSLAEGGALAAAPTIGIVFTLVAWGAAADRWGERRTLVAGLAATLGVIALSLLATGPIALALAFGATGAASGCTSAASGRLIVGWFPPARRGLAMGIRQTCTPLGIAIGAVTVPTILDATGSIPAALTVGGALVAVALLAVTLTVVDPVRAPRDAATPAPNPYRASGTLARIHAASMLLVVPQFTLQVFGLVWLIVGLGVDTVPAGIIVALAQLGGAATRIGVGVVSDRAGSRLAPMRVVALSAAVLTLATAGAAAIGAVPLAVACYVLASCATVAPNGLAFTAVAEIAGPAWAGRALGTQNTGQFIAGSIAPPVVGGLIGLVGYPLAYAIVAVTALAAIPVVPRDPHPEPSAP